MKSTFLDLRRSRFPEAIGACFPDAPRIASAANECVQNLMLDPRQPDTGWYGTWVQMVFTVTRSDPYITAPRGLARIMLMDVCSKPIPMQNEFYSYLLHGVGYLPNTVCTGTTACNTLTPLFSQGIRRAVVSTLVDVPTTNPCYIRAYPTDPQDVGKKLLIQAYDQNDLKVYGYVGSQQMEGFDITLDYPFVDSIVTVGSKGIYGVQKDYTFGDVPLKAVDSVTAEETSIARYEPGEIRPQYVRYYLDSLPQYCCNGVPSLQVNAMCKRDYYPVAVDSDWLLIGNIPALIREAQAIYHDGIQEAAAAVMSAKKHNDAILLLQGELDHYLGKEKPATNVNIFGSARTRYQEIGSIV